jgi:hypothetical protein
MIWRVFLNDVLECVRCKGRMEIVAALTSGHAIERVLGHLGLPLAAPEFHPARPPPQIEMTFGHEPSGFYPDPPPPDEFAAEGRPAINRPSGPILGWMPKCVRGTKRSLFSP